MEFNLSLFLFGVFITFLVVLGVLLALAELRAAHTPDAPETTGSNQPSSGTLQGE